MDRHIRLKVNIGSAHALFSTGSRLGLNMHSFLLSWLRSRTDQTAPLKQRQHLPLLQDHLPTQPGTIKQSRRPRPFGTHVCDSPTVRGPSVSRWKQGLSTSGKRMYSASSEGALPSQPSPHKAQAKLSRWVTRSCESRSGLVMLQAFNFGVF